MRWLILLALAACETKQEAADREWADKKQSQRRATICTEFCDGQDNRLVPNGATWTCTCADGNHLVFDDMRVFYQKHE